MDDIKEESLSKHDALSIRNDIKRIAKEKITLDEAFCEQLYYSKYSTVLVGINSVSFYEYCGYDSWKEYIEQEVQLTVKKANRFVAVYNKYFVEIEGMSKKDMIDLDKMYMLIPVINQQNFRAMLNKAKTADKATLKATVSSNPNRKMIGFFVENLKEVRIVDRAMDKARTEFGEDLTNAQIFLAILSEYVENSKNIKKSA